MMVESLVLTAVGPDRPGLVDRLSSLVAEHGGNWVESRMAHLSDQFAGIVRIDVPSENASALREALRALKSATGLRVSVTEAKSAAAQSQAAGVRAGLDVVGHDRPGILREVSHALASRGINVEELRTECVSAPWSGEILFKASAVLTLPDGLTIDQLRDDLETAAGDLGLDIAITPADAATTPGSQAG